MMLAWLSIVIGLSACAPVMVPRPVTQDKAALTPAERKIDSQLRVEIARLTSKDRIKTAVRIDKASRAYVDIRADVSPALEQEIKNNGGAIVSTSREFRSIVAWVPLSKIARLAESPAVYAIVPTPEAAIRK